MEKFHKEAIQEVIVGTLCRLRENLGESISAKQVNKSLLDYLLKSYDSSRKASVENELLLEECRSQIVRQIGLVLSGVYANDLQYPNSYESILIDYLIDHRLSFDLLRHLMSELLPTENNADLLNSTFGVVLFYCFIKRLIRTISYSIIYRCLLPL